MRSGRVDASVRVCVVCCGCILRGVWCLYIVCASVVCGVPGREACVCCVVVYLYSRVLCGVGVCVNACMYIGVRSLVCRCVHM